MLCWVPKPYLTVAVAMLVHVIIISYVELRFATSDVAWFNRLMVVRLRLKTLLRASHDGHKLKL